MHMLAYKIARFSFFFACIFDREILDSIRRCVIAPPVYNSESENPENSTFGGERVNVLKYFLFCLIVS